ncbi:hypothetical protein [Streptosporangium carneum]|uniref:Uncharacterized protein n=1 Tax=Streptosporangium carneum TaxID=47481 RepID=A0A9W6MDR6_9ACTN|nr:hypothetical protein [Streptosporangium carneum]GLK10195.1 hypothetical protein GCM10017600_36010 [Streptosporangium carneum]
MSDTDDLDRRFAAIASQTDQDERRRMSDTAAKEWSNLPRNRRRRRRWITVLAACVLVAGAGVVVAYRPEVVTQVRDALAEQLSDTGGLSLGAIPEETMTVDAVPPSVSPFEGSPAKDYAEGVKGLVMPPATTRGGLSRKDVAAALKRTRDMLAASHLDRRTLMGGRPTALVRLLDPELRPWFLKNLDRRKPGNDSNTRYWVTSLAPKAAELATDVIKVNGRTKYSAFREDGRTGIRITVNYLFVYAVQRPGQPESVTRVISHNMGELLAYRENGALVVWPVEWNSGTVTGVRCDVQDGFVHPFYEDSAPDKEVVEATGAPLDPYDLDHDSGDDNSCRAASRS